MSPSLHLRQVIASRLRALMALRPDLDTQVKLAQRAGVSQSTVARILSADSAATADSIAQLAHALGAPPASLLLSDPTEIALLEDIQALKPDARQRLLGFVAGLLSDQVSPFSVNLSIPMPPSLRAAHAKAVARPIEAPEPVKTTGHGKKNTSGGSR